MRRLPDTPQTRQDRPASALLHDEANVRVVAFALEPGQVVPPHASASTVLVHVLRGGGRFLGAADEALLVPGESVVYGPAESHSIEAGPEGVHFLAIISPGPR